MLQYILGRAASGKSFEIIKRIKKATDSGKRPVLIVPEQFSFESERAVLEAVGDEAAQRVSVLSFTRLCDEIERISGGMAGRIMTDADRSIISGRAVRRACDRLRIFKRYSRSVGFNLAMLDMINEFKLNAVTPEDVMNVSNAVGTGAFADKLHDIAVVYASFEELIAERFLDPSSRLDIACERLESCRCFFERPVFMDSFKGFTGQQYKIISRIFSQTSDVTVALCLDNGENLRVFENIVAVKKKITAIALSNGVNRAEDVVLEKSRYENAGLSVLEQIMAGEHFENRSRCGGVTVCTADTVFDEAEFAARTIRRIVREKGARFNDFVIIARDTAAYEQPLGAACRRNGVNCFIDRRAELSCTPPVVCAVAAMEAAIKLTTERILRFHKSGIGLLTFDEISELENYTYLWNIDGDRFFDEWDMNPDGFVRSGTDNTARLERLNALRRRAAEPLLKFKQSFSGSAADRSRAIYDLLSDCRAADAFKTAERECRSKNDEYSAELLRRSWDELMLLLDSLAVCFSDEEISSGEFYTAFKNASCSVTIGIVPQTLDEVTFGAADRIRPSRPKYAFILGAAQGVFPRSLPAGGLLNSPERSRLAEFGIEIPDCSAKTAADEDFLIYSNVCCASRGVFISCPNNYDGSAVSPSVFLSDICKNEGVTQVFEPGNMDENGLPETKEAAFSELCRRNSYDGTAAVSLAAALSDTGINKERISAVFSQSEPETFSLTAETAQKLFGTNIRMSPSKFDDFSRCRFMYFCRDGLNIRRLQPAAFDALQRGTLIHYVLQRVIETYKKDVSLLSETEISDAVDRFTEEYLDSITGYHSVETAYLKFIVSVIKRSLKYIVGRLSLEFAQSDFVPVRCELGIGDTDGMPAIEIPIAENFKITLNGTVDRLDSWNGYIRIIDYKTGSRSFKLPDILFGQNMQMLIYLYAVSKSSEFGGIPAGILYMPAKRNPNSAASERRMNGLILNDKNVHNAMEKENRGEFVPRLTEKSESFLSDDDFKKIFAFIDLKLKQAGKRIISGDIAASPVDGIDSPACKYCDFGAICRKKDEKHDCVVRMKNEQVMEIIDGEMNENGV